MNVRDWMWLAAAVALLFLAGVLYDVPHVAAPLFVAACACYGRHRWQHGWACGHDDAQPRPIPREDTRP